DRAREADVQRRGAQPAVADVAPVAAERQPAAGRVAERLDADDRPALGADADADAGPDFADHARRRAFDRLGVLADGRAPVAAVAVDELARVGARGAMQATGRPRRTALARPGIVPAGSP